MCAAYRGELLPTHSAVEVGTLQQLPQCPFHHTVAEMLNDLGDNLRGERFGIISHNYSATFTVMACLFFNSCTFFLDLETVHKVFRVPGSTHHLWVLGSRLHSISQYD